MYQRLFKKKKKTTYTWKCNWLDPNVVGLFFTQQSTLDWCWGNQTETDYPKSKAYPSPERGKSTINTGNPWI